MQKSKEELIELRKKLFQERQEKITKYWEEVRDVFETPDDVPSLPVTDRKTWNEYYVPILIERGAIPKDKLIIGKTYLGNCRNATKAVWDGHRFIYERYKLGEYYKEPINHFEDDDGYDLFVPIKELD